MCDGASPFGWRSADTRRHLPFAIASARDLLIHGPVDRAALPAMVGTSNYVLLFRAGSAASPWSGRDSAGRPSHTRHRQSQPADPQVAAAYGEQGYAEQEHR